MGIYSFCQSDLAPGSEVRGRVALDWGVEFSYPRLDQTDAGCNRTSVWGVIKPSTKSREEDSVKNTPAHLFYPDFDIVGATRCGGLPNYIFVPFVCFVVYIIRSNYHEEHEEEYKGKHKACPYGRKTVVTSR